MQVDRPRANGASSGQRNVGDARSRDGGAQREDGRAHGFHQFVRSHGVIQRVRLDGVGGGWEFRCGNLGGHKGQQFAHGDDVANHGNVAQGNGFGGKQRRCHRGQR
jgi:hypothetical protein